MGAPATFETWRAVLAPAEAERVARLEAAGLVTDADRAAPDDELRWLLELDEDEFDTLVRGVSDLGVCDPYPVIADEDAEELIRVLKVVFRIVAVMVALETICKLLLAVPLFLIAAPIVLALRAGRLVGLFLGGVTVWLAAGIAAQARADVLMVGLARRASLSWLRLGNGDALDYRRWAERQSVRNDADELAEGVAFDIAEGTASRLVLWAQLPVCCVRIRARVVRRRRPEVA